MKKVYSAIANLCLFLIIYFTVGINFETVDDITTSQLIMSGGFNIYSLQWISYVSRLFNHMFAPINGYGLLLVLLVYISSYKLTEIIIKKETKKNYLFTKMGLLFIVDFWVLYQLQFTVVASFCLTVGTILVNNFLTNKKNKLDLIIGIALFFCGVSLRKSAIIFAVPLIILFVLFNTEKKEILKKSLYFLILSSICLTSWFVDFSSYTDEYKDYYYYNDARHSVFDKIHERTDEYITPTTEFSMLSYHITGDTDYFTTEKINEIYKKNNAQINKPKLFISNVLFFFPHNLSQHFTLLLLLLLFIYAYKDKKDLYKSIVIVLFVIGYILIYSFINRYVERIMFASTIPLIIYLLLENRKIDFKKFVILLSGLLIISSIEFYDTYTKQQSNRTEYLELKEKIESTPENIYYQTLGATLYTGNVLPALNSEIVSLPLNVLTFSWNTNHPVLLKQTELNNIKNPLLDLLEKDNYYLITANYDMESNIILDYLEENYNIIAQREIKKLSDNYAILKITK